MTEKDLKPLLERIAGALERLAPPISKSNNIEIDDAFKDIAKNINILNISKFLIKYLKHKLIKIIKKIVIKILGKRLGNIIASYFGSESSRKKL